MALSPQYRDYALDLLAPLGPVRARRMFGGGGLFHGDVMFAFISGEELYFKVDDANRPDYEAAGEPPLTFRRGGKDRALKSYYRVPDTLYDDADELLLWARKAVDAALTADRAKVKRAKR